MRKSLLFVTDNPHKKKRFTAYFRPLGLSVITSSDLGKKLKVVEDGKSAIENAVKKAMAGFRETGLASFGVDYWFRIEGLSKDLQPGPFVRRIFAGKGGERREATDEEMINYYQKIIKNLGGETKGVWTSAIALVTTSETIFTETFSRETILTSKRSPKVTPGEPLNSLQIDKKTKKYFTDLTQEEWILLETSSEKKYIDFMKKHLGRF